MESSAWVCLCIQYSKCVTPSHITHQCMWKVTMFSNLFVRCTSGGEPMTFRLAHNAWIQMYMGWKKTFSWSLVPPLSSQSALCLFSQICQCHFGLWVIFYPQCLTDRRGSGICENQSRALRWILSLCAAVSARATAGHLLCGVKTDLCRTNVEFQLER